MFHAKTAVPEPFQRMHASGRGYRSDHEQGEGGANTTRGQSGLSGSLASGTSPRQDTMEEHMKDKGP